MIYQFFQRLERTVGRKNLQVRYIPNIGWEITSQGKTVTLLETDLQGNVDQDAKARAIAKELGW